MDLQVSRAGLWGDSWCCWMGSMWGDKAQDRERVHLWKDFQVFANASEKDQPVNPRVLSLVVKTSHCYWKILTPPKLGSKKTVLIIAFRIALTLDVKTVWFGRQVALCVQKMQYLVVVGFKSSTLTVYCLNSWFIHKQLKRNSNLCVLFWLSHLSWFLGPRYFPPSFWPWVTNHDDKSKIKRKWFFRSLLFCTTFS